MANVSSLLVFFAIFVVSVYGHGYLFEPVARSSAWLVDPSFKQCCTHPNHMEMFCGGIGRQWNVNDGKCSICGEPYDQEVKLFEKGGAMYKGSIVKTYSQGQEIDVKVMLTANHKGYFEFRLCNLDASPSADATQECLDRHLLRIAGTDSTRFREVGNYGSEMITVRVQLPSDVACQHCVFQWKYTAGNSWGRDPVTGESGAGLGRENETFMGCADITILPNGSPTDPPMVIIPTITPATTRSTSSYSQWTWWTTTSTFSSSSPSTYWTWWPTTSTSSSSGSPTHWTWWPTTSTTESTSTSTREWSTGTTASTTTRPPLGLTTWSSDLVEYHEGDEVMYDGKKYRCISTHRSFIGAEPGLLTWAWWQPVEDNSESFL